MGYREGGLEDMPKTELKGGNWGVENMEKVG